MQDTAAGRLVERALAASAAGAHLGPDAVTLLARAYAASGDEQIGDAVGLMLAQALRDASDVPSWRPSPSEGRPDWAAERAAWLALFVDMAALSDDGRIRKTIAAVTHALVAGWPGSASPGSTMREIEAALRAALVVQPSFAGRIVEELEREVARAYRPGRGLIGGGPDGGPGTLDDHVQMAAGLLTAHAATDRLPYAMLADDLMQFARHQWWAEGPIPRAPSDVAPLCAACRVLARLSRVHADPAYGQAAVVTAYRHLEDAERLLDALADAAGALGLDACAYVLAAEEVGRPRNED